jgi:two-component system NtrC family sensor kinase
MASQRPSCPKGYLHQEKKLDTGTLQLYKSALSATSCGIVISDARLPQNPIIYCNAAFEKITGYSQDEVIGRNCRFLQGDKTDPKAIEKIRQSLRKEQGCEVVLQNYRKDGTLFWNDLTISPVRDADGCLTHFIGVQTDITLRKQAEETQKLMQFSIDCAADAVFYICADGSFFYVNEAASHSLGYSQEQLLMMNIQDIDANFTKAFWSLHWQKVKKKGSLKFDTQHRTKDGRFLNVEVTLNYLKFKEQEYNFAFVRDISARKRAEAALRKSQEQYRTLAKNFPNGAVLLFDQDYRYLIADGVELKRLGLTQKAVEGKTISEVFSAEVTAVFEPKYQAALAGKTEVFEYGFGGRIYLVYVLPVTNEDGEIWAGMVTTQNISARKQSERKLQRSNTILKAQQEAALEGVLVSDEKNAISSYNHRFCEMWEIPEPVCKSKNKNKILECILPQIVNPLKVGSQVEYLEAHLTEVGRQEIYLKDGRVFDCYSAPALSPQGEYYGRIWSFRDITQRKQTEIRLRQQAEREQLLAGMNQRIRQSLKLEKVLNTAVAEVRLFLDCERATIYRFEPDWSGTIVVESVKSGWMPVLGKEIRDNCFKENKAVHYQQGRVSATEDIYNADFTECHIQLLEGCQVRANLVVPILQKDQLWGLLIAHQCSGTRKWQESEVELLRQLSVQLSVAIQQAALFEQLAAELSERKAAEAALRQSETALKRQKLQLEQTLDELKQTQIQLIQTEKMSSLGQLVAGVAHEINNPVTFIAGNISHAAIYAKDLLRLVQLYAQNYPEPIAEIEDLIEDIDFDFLMKDFPKLLNSMNIGASRIRQIVLSLKNFSRLDESERKLADIHEGIDNTLLILQHRLKPEAANIQLIKEYGTLPLIECYPGQLNQVFMNILNNAIDALENCDNKPIWTDLKPLTADLQSTPRLIQISTEVVDISTRLKAESSQNLQSAVIRIADNGPGIPHGVRQRIFDPFFTTKAVGDGTGLGLSISYQIVVEKHGGNLQCISQPGMGTEFLVEIPLNPSRLT